MLIMEFIGKNGVNAPSMKELSPKKPEKLFRTLSTCLKRLYCKAKLVHGDLSEYNIMYWKSKPWIFDVSQGVNLKHPNSAQFLTRDLENLNRYFRKLGVEVFSLEDIFRRVTDGTIIC